MIRDTRRDEAYFDKWIDFRQKVIAEGIGKSYPRLEGQALHVSSLFSYSLKICIKSYSRGDSLSAMKGSVWQALEMREKMNDTLKAISVVITANVCLVRYYHQ